MKGDEQLDCMSEAIEADGAWGTPYPFVPEDVVFTVKIDDSEYPAQLQDHFRFGENQNEPRVGTAYLIIIDADARVGKAFDELRDVATQFVASMGTHDWVSVVVLGPNSVVSDSGWLTRGGHDQARRAISKQEDTIRTRDRTRPLLDLIRKSASHAFRALAGGSDAGSLPPLHQAMVVLSSGYGGGDPSTTGPGAAELSKFFTEGRLDPKNSALPKLPIPIISIFTPPKAHAEHVQFARSFMENLANQQIGGFFSVIRDGQADHKTRIVDAVRSRFSQMILARFTLSCVAPSTTQSFSLLFKNKSQHILGDSSFSGVPVGFDPAAWPLNVDGELTRKKAKEQGGIHPGGSVTVLGNFCWGSDTSRPEIYFIPPGEPLPKDTKDPNAAREIQKRLISLDMRGKTLQANSSFAEFKVPESSQILHGDGERRSVRVVVVDSKLKRTSGLLEATVLTLKGQELPLPMMPIVAAASGAVVLLLVVGLLLRRGSRKSQVAASREHIPSEQSPYARPAPVSRVPRNGNRALRATLEGPAGRFVILPGTDLRAGRDGTRAAAVIGHHQVSGLHATFRLEDNQLKVRDESSTSGTRLDNRIIQPGTWETVANGAQVALGPEVFTVTIETSSRR